MKKRVLIIGPILTQSGYGHHSRTVLRSLRSREDLFDIYLRPINWGQTSWLSEASEEREWIDEKIKNRRDDFTHELSRALANLSFNAYAVEDLDINQMKLKKAPVKGKNGNF